MTKKKVGKIAAFVEIYQSRLKKPSESYQEMKAQEHTIPKHRALQYQAASLNWANIHMSTALPCAQSHYRLVAVIVSLVLSLLYCISSLAYAEGDPPFQLPPRPELLKIRSAILETTKGKLYFELFPEEAPWHVANFKYLADTGFYNGLLFHFFEPNRFIQGGDPLGNGTGGPGYSLPAEFSSRNHRFGTLGMARKPDAYNSKRELVNPERRSSGSQFHIMLTDAPHMDGRYTIFGKLVGGSEVLRQLRRDDKILKLTVFIRQGGR